MKVANAIRTILTVVIVGLLLAYKVSVDGERAIGDFVFWFVIFFVAYSVGLPDGLTTWLGLLRNVPTWGMIAAIIGAIALIWPAVSKIGSYASRIITRDFGALQCVGFLGLIVLAIIFIVLHFRRKPAVVDDEDE